MQYPPQPYGQPLKPAPTRSTVATVFGILNIIFGGLGLLCTPFALLINLVPQPDNPWQAAMPPVVNAWTNINMVLAIVASVVLIIAGVGLLQVRPWGRLLSIGYAIYALVMWALGTLILIIFAVPAVMHAAERAGPEAAGLYGGLFGGIAASCVGAIYPIVLLVFMFRPPITHEFARR